MSKENVNKKVEVDKTTFLVSLIFLVSICAYCVFLPEQANNMVNAARTWVITKWDWLFLGFGAFTIVVSIWLAFSKYGKIKLGLKDEKPEFSMKSWIAMMFCAGVGSSVIHWSILEPLYYLQGPPYGYEPFSQEAYNISVAYGIFHWGPVAWSFFALPCLPVAYYFLVKRKQNLKISEVCGDVIGKKNAKGPLGKLIDVLVVFATFGGMGPGLGLGVPLLSLYISTLFGIERTFTLDLLVLLIWTSIFTFSVYRGLGKGIKLLSDINVYIILGLLAFVVIVGPTIFILQNTVDSVGYLFQNIIRWSTYADPIGQGGFAQGWTVFYWAWYLALTPFMAIFIARISKGRTIKEFLLGIIGMGSLGTGVFFMIFGSYTAYIQSSGILDAANILSTEGFPSAVLSVFMTLPFSKLILAVLIVLYFVFLATCIDSGAYAMACVTSKELTVNQQPQRWNRLVWAGSIAMLGVAVLRLGGLKAIQTSVIAMGFPVLFISIIMYIALYKWLKNDVHNIKDIEISTENEVSIDSN